MSSASTSIATPEQTRIARKAVIAASLGNALEWFDVIVYASFAVVITRLFFPGGSGATGLLLKIGRAHV